MTTDHPRLEHEGWVPIPSLPGYEASTLGRIRSLDRFVPYSDGRRRMHRGQVLQPGRDNGRGYQYVNVNKGQTRTVHTLVLEAFAGPPPRDGLYGCHDDGNKQNNRPGNLRWDTPSANQHDSMRHGTHARTSRTHCPRRHPLQSPNLVAAKALRGHRQCLACDRAKRYCSSALTRKGVVLAFEPIADAYYAALSSVGAAA